MEEDISIQDLADLIVENIADNFKYAHKSYNLVKTITVNKTENGIVIDVPADRYDRKKWEKDKVVVYLNNNKSYASLLDHSKSNPNHVNYVEDSINNAIATWLTNNKQEAKVSNIKGSK